MSPVLPRENGLLGDLAFFLIYTWKCVTLPHMEDVTKQREDQKTLELSVKGVANDGREISLRNTDIDTLTKYLGQWRRLVGQNVDIKLENGSIKATVTATSALIAGLVADCDHYAKGNTSEIPRERLSVFRQMEQDAKEGHRQYGVTCEGRQCLRIGPDIHRKAVRNRVEEAELEIEGTVTDAGGEGSPNIHLFNKHGKYTISVDRQFLEGLSENILYKTIRVLVKCKYDVVEQVYKDYTLKEIVDTPILDEQKLAAAIKQGTKDWQGVDDPYKWLVSVRGGEE